MSDPYQDHPSQQALLRYVLDELPEPEFTTAEEHLLVCEACRQTVSELDVFAPALRKSVRKRVSVTFVHWTADGPLHMELRALPDSKWGARFWGPLTEGSAVFTSVEEAYAHLRRSFEDMYPEHLCTDRCGLPEK